MQDSKSLTIIFFIYGLAFFSMALAVLLERDRSSDVRMRLSLRPLIVFGFLHGLHEWIDMFEEIGLNLPSESLVSLWAAFKLIILAFSFLSLAGFGFSLISPNLRIRRLSLMAPLALVAIWAFGMFFLNARYNFTGQACVIPCVWTRYALGIPSALAASFGLVAQQRAFRRSGMPKFGRDSLAAAVAFAWYGLVGQLFVPPSRLPPSTFINSDLFLDMFGFPVQLLRAGLAVLIALFVIRFMRAFDSEIKAQLSELQAIRLEEARRREAMRGGLIKQIVAAQESERQRIARELHDDTGQALTALGLGLRGVTATLKSDPEKAGHNLRKLEHLATNSLNELQRIIANLRPSHLDDLGLAAAVRWFISDTQNHTNISIRYQQEGEDSDMPDPVKIAMYRVVQEATTNALKHSQADWIEVLLCFKDSSVCARIRDNGIGMALDEMRNLPGQSWGLIGMRERAQLLDGEFVLKSQPGSGVEVRVTIPFELDSNVVTDLGVEL